MARLKPIKLDTDDSVRVAITINVSQEIADKISEEQDRVGIRNRSELCRMILEEYFKQEVEEG